MGIYCAIGWRLFCSFFFLLLLMRGFFDEGLGCGESNYQNPIVISFIFRPGKKAW